ncbi:DUF4352 domain-containing protein [Microbacterium sp. NPDC057407]|uniref:DUF4352 domain-containing protein n=1 Tax=Microbacterium sp. NPDC057407 TaxID=3346120 RepID=UPI00366AB844
MAKCIWGMNVGQRATLRRLSIRLSAVVAGATLCALAITACAPAEPTPGTQNSDPLPTATVPAPNGGSIEETVEPVDPGPTQEAELGDTAELEGGVNVTVSEVEQLEVKAETPGEIAGPAVALTLTVENDSGESIDLSTAMVSVTGSKDSYGQATTSEPYSPFLGSLEPGEEASGIYVFRLPAEERDSLQVTVEYIAGAPIALFTGDV